MAGEAKTKRRKVKGYVGIYVQESTKRKFQGKFDLCFYYTIKRDGKLIWHKIGWKSEGFSARQAWEMRNKALQSRVLGEPIQKDITLDELFKKYIAYAKTKKKTWQKDQERYKNHLEPYFGGETLVKQIGIKEVEGFKQYRLSQGRKPATINRELALLKTMFNRAKLWGFMEGDNPVSLAGMLPENNLGVARFLSKEQAQAILKQCNPWARPVIAFLMSTGLRVNNALGLTWDMVDMEQGVIHLPQTKSGRPMIVPLSKWARQILENLPKREESLYVFCKGNGEPIPYDSLRDAFRRACKRAGVGHVRLHDLRHSWASWMVAAGVPTPLLQLLGNWSTLAMLSRYSHASPQALAKMADKALELPEED